MRRGKLRRRIGIVRGIFPRATQVEYAANFSKLKPVFISSNPSQEVKNLIKELGLESCCLEIKEMYGVDLVRWLLGKQTHQSWIGVEGLEEVSEGVDVLETHELYSLYSGQTAQVAKKLGKPLVTEVWTSLAGHLGYKLPPYRWATKKVLRNTRLFVARSKGAAQALRKLGVEEERLITLYYGVNIDRFKPVKKKRDKDELRVLFVGTLEWYKGVDFLLDIWGEIRKKQPRAKLWLVGKGSLLPQAKKTEGVRAVGYMEHKKLAAIYQQADVFVSPSRDQYFGPWLRVAEYFSHTLMEAQASGLPVVTTYCGGIPEEVGNNNWLVEQKDKEGLFKALVEVLGDRKKREKAGRENRQRAERLYDLNKQVKKLEVEIEKIC